MGEGEALGASGTESDGSTVEVAAPASESVAAPLLPRLLSEIVDLREAVTVLRAELEGIEAAIRGVESVVSDRLIDHTETIQEAARKQTAAVNDYRADGEKALLDLRRALVDSDDLVRSLLTRIDDLAVDVADTRQAVAANDAPVDLEPLRREILAAVEQVALPREVEVDASAFLTPVEQVGEAVVTVRTELHTAFTSIADQLTKLLRRADARPSVASPPPAPAPMGVPDEVRDALHLIHDELAQLKRRIAVRSKAVTDDDVERIADVVVARLADVFEVVEDEPSPPPPRPTARPAPADAATKAPAKKAAAPAPKTPAPATKATPATKRAPRSARR